VDGRRNWMVEGVMEWWNNGWWIWGWERRGREWEKHKIQSTR
jgi:hypothetical protein